MHLRIIKTKLLIHIQIIMFASFISQMIITLKLLTVSLGKEPSMAESQNGKRTTSKHPSAYSGRFTIISENALILHLNHLSRANYNRTRAHFYTPAPYIVRCADLHRTKGCICTRTPFLNRYILQKPTYDHNHRSV